ncbi:MAG: hypothetical protein VX519_04555 [Myxococcota bacterium]|nr:hypothetical protein [Myxococcota bacterium]
MWLGLLVATLHAAEGTYEVRNLGEVLEKAPVALVVTTPGVAVEAYLGWVDALESEGFDARLLVFPASLRGWDAGVAGVKSAVADLGTQEWVLAAHGYGGVLALMAGVQPERLALIATPLAPQVTKLSVPELSEQQGLPWPQSWIGELPVTWLSPEMGQAYLSLARVMPSYAPPVCPTWLVASGSDPIAPPETVRLASVGWPQRTWHRAGILSLSGSEFQHADLLLDAGLAREMSEFLSGAE